MRIDVQYVLEFLMLIFAFAAPARLRRFRNWKAELGGNLIYLFPLFLFFALTTGQRYPYWQILVSVILGAALGAVLSTLLEEYMRKFGAKYGGKHTKKKPGAVCNTDTE